MSRRSRGIAGLGVGTVALLALVSVQGLVGESRQESPQRSLTGGVDVTWEDMGEKIDLSQADAKLGMKAERPSHDLANDSLLSDVWYGTTEVVAFQYNTGIEVDVWSGQWILDQYASGDDFFTKMAEGFAAEFDVAAESLLTTVNETTALAVPKGLDGQSDLGAVTFLTPNALYVAVYGNFDIETLTAIAESVK